MQVSVSALCLSDFVICTASAHFTDVRCPLWPKTNHTIKIKGLLQPQRALHSSQKIFNHCSLDQLLEYRMSFYKTISSEFLVHGNFKNTQFSQEQYWWDLHLQPLAPQASTVSTELIDCLLTLLQWLMEWLLSSPEQAIDLCKQAQSG